MLDTAMLADMVTGKTGTAEVLFLIAAVLFGIVTLMRFQVKAWDMALLSAGWCLLAVGFFVL